MLAAQDWRGITATLAPFNRRYTQRIRNLRLRVQPLAAAKCYQQLKALELAAERLEQQIIAMALDSSIGLTPWRQLSGESGNQVLSNLLAYQASWSPKSADVDSLVSKLAAALLRGDAIKRNQSRP